MRLLREAGKHGAAIKKGLKLGQFGDRQSFQLRVPVTDMMMLHLSLFRRED